MGLLTGWAMLFLSLLASGNGDDLKDRSGAKELFFAVEGQANDLISVAPSKKGQGAARSGPKKHSSGDLLTVEFDNGSLDGLDERPKCRSSGLRHWIELVESGSQRGQKVSPDRVFRTGERIRLHFQTNRDGYISLLQLSDDSSQVLFPAPGKGFADSFISASEDRVLPGPNAWFRFDHRTGIEKLVVVFSPELEALERIIPGREPLRAPVEEDRLAQLASLPPGAKGLVVESERQDPTQVGHYAVSLTGEPIVLEIQLVHE